MEMQKLARSEKATGLATKRVRGRFDASISIETYDSSGTVAILIQMDRRSLFSRRDLLSKTGALAAGSLAVGVDAASSASAQDASSGAVDATPGALQSTGVLYNAAAGPWGMLQYYFFYLEAPQFLIDAFPLPNPRTRWAVPTAREREFRSLLEEIFMSAEARVALADPVNIGVADGLYAVFPPAFVITSLDPAARAQLYQYLAQFEMNPEIRDPIRIFSGSVDEWANGTRMRPDLIELMKEMCYQRHGLLNFADIPFLVSQAKTQEEARALQRNSSRVRTMVIRLDLNKLGDMEQMVDYWTTGLGLRRKQIEPIIESGKLTPGVAGLDIVHLLPPLARKLLYTYPDLSMAVEGKLPDCHWTALNFFNYNPETIYLEELFAASGLLSDFDTLDEPLRFGDLLVFVTPAMNALHSCVYLAADIVYTKNGRSLFAPWVALHLDDVKKLYSESGGQPLRIQGFRKKKILSEAN